MAVAHKPAASSSSFSVGPATRAATPSRPKASAIVRCKSETTCQQAAPTLPASSRREALLGVAAATLAAAAAAATPSPAVAASAAEVEDAAEFYARWPYVVPADILPFIRERAAPGDAAAVLAALDEWATHYPMYAIGAEKGQLLDEVLEDLRPRLALEIGTFLGYSAIRTARKLALGGLLVCIEANPENASTARQIIDHAGVGSKVVIVEGLGNQKLPAAAKLLAEAAATSSSSGGKAAAAAAGSSAGGQQQQQRVLPGLRAEAAKAEAAASSQPAEQQEGEQQQEGQQQQQASPLGVPVDYFFLDHCKPCYAPDLIAAEALGLVGPGTVVAADNVVFPGAPGYLEHLETSGRYVTRLLAAPHEVDQPWNPNWEMGKADAVAVSLRW